MRMNKEQLKKYKHLYAFLKWGNRTRRYIKYGVYAEEVKFYIRSTLRKLHILPVDPYIASLRDKYKGEKIFVIATGPSLTVEDLELIRNSGAISISANTIFKVYTHTEWRPDYYVTGDYKGLWRLHNFHKGVRLDRVSSKGTILSLQCKKLMPYEMETPVGYVDTCYLDHWENLQSESFKYNRDIRYGLYDMFTVTCDMINIADYMGADEIYLVGCDCNYGGPTRHVGEVVRKNYSEEDDKRGAGIPNHMVRGYEALNRLKRDDLKIYNATRGGRLEVFERIALEEAVARAAK